MASRIDRGDWERFRALGHAAPGISDLVLSSWRRSDGVQGISNRTRAPSLGADELSSLRHRNQRLRVAAGGMVQRTGQMLDDAGAMLLLCDRRGVVMEALGDARILSRGEENHLHPGGCWDEAGIGTNAIGTALHLAQPVAISGAEHYCEAIQRWSCAAAPIRDPVTGRLLGVVDISGPSDVALGPVAALSVSLAEGIGQAVQAARQAEHRQLIESLLARRGKGDAGAVLLLDRDGIPVWSGPDFSRLFKDQAADLSLIDTMPMQAEGGLRMLAARMRAALPGAGVEYLGGRRDPLGLCVTLSPPRRPAPKRQVAPPEITLAEIAGVSAAQAALCSRAQAFVEAGIALVLAGPSGSGKTTLARALHRASPLAALPFVLVDCAVAAPDLHALQAAGGTLCLIAPMALADAARARLLADLADLAEAQPVQILTLAESPPEQPFARLNGAVLRLPPLAARRADLPALLRRFAGRHAPVLRFGPEVTRRLQAHSWPGNLHELRQLVQALAATVAGRQVRLADLPEALAIPPALSRAESLRGQERAAILRALEEAGGNVTATARRLGIARSTLYLKLDQYRPDAKDG